MLARRLSVTAAQSCVTINVLMLNLMPRAFWVSFWVTLDTRPHRVWILEIASRTPLYHLLEEDTDT